MGTFFTIFLSIFVAELGDKTQLATLLFATNPGQSRLGVLLAASSALVCSSILAVGLGAQIARCFSPLTLKVVAGIGFIFVGIWTLLSARI